MTFPDFDNTETQILELTSTLENINYQMAELARIKEALEQQLFIKIGHGEDGSKSYIHGKYKVTVTTGYNYTLNKDEYLVMGSHLPKCFDPVIQRIAYDLDKSVIKDCEKYGSPSELKLLSDIISKKPKKLHVKITSAI